MAHPEKSTQERFFTFVSISMQEVDIPSSVSTPVSLTDELVDDFEIEEIELFFGRDVYATWAENFTQAISNLMDKTKRRKFKGCMVKSYFRRDRGDTLRLYVRSTGDALVEGIDKEIYKHRKIC